MKKTTILAAALVVLAMQAQGQDEAQRFVTGNGLSQAAEEFGCVVPSRSRRPWRALCSPVPYVDRPAPIAACYARECRGGATTGMLCLPDLCPWLLGESAIPQYRCQRHATQKR